MDHRGILLLLNLMFAYIFFSSSSCIQFPPGTDPQVIREQLQINRDNSLIVCIEGRLTLEFVCGDLMRIKKWHFSTRHHRELVPKNLIAFQAQQDPTAIEMLSKNVTQQGFTHTTINYLKVRLHFSYTLYLLRVSLSLLSY